MNRNVAMYCLIVKVSNPSVLLLGEPTQDPQSLALGNVCECRKSRVGSFCFEAMNNANNLCDREGGLWSKLQLVVLPPTLAGGRRLALFGSRQKTSNANCLSQNLTSLAARREFISRMGGFLLHPSLQLSTSNRIDRKTTTDKTLFA